MRAVVVGASSGLGRCIGIGLARRGANVALLARRQELLDSAVVEAGNGTVSAVCDVTDADSCATAVKEAAEALGGIDAVIYAPAVGQLARLVDTGAETWRRTFDTNVMGASLFTAAALPHLQASAGRAVYLSSVSASQTAPWPGLGAYVVSKAALDKLVEAWRGEHPEVAFTRLVIGDCTGGDGDGQSQFATGWDVDLAIEMHGQWTARGLMAGCFIEIEELIDSVDSLLRSGGSLNLPSVIVAPRPPAP